MVGGVVTGFKHADCFEVHIPLHHTTHRPQLVFTCIAKQAHPIPPSVSTTPLLPAQSDEGTVLWCIILRPGGVRERRLAVDSVAGPLGR